MTDRHLAIVMERLLGEHAPHLHEEVVQTIADRVFVRQPPTAVVVSLNEMRSQAWGTCRRFTTVGSVDVYA